uniref:Uncharacterized protein n=1 Tax=Arundo donax TaxID=35708 RepID=A0A0A9HFV6_ARUDO
MFDFFCDLVITSKSDNALGCY